MPKACREVKLVIENGSDTSDILQLLPTESVVSINMPSTVDGTYFNVKSATSNGPMNDVWNSGDAQYQLLNGSTSDYDVSFPAGVPDLSYLIKNIGATNNLIIKDNGGSTLTTLNPGQILWAIYDGTEWQQLN